MSDDALLHRIEALEADNARLRRLLQGQGSTAGERHHVRNTLAMLRDVVRRSSARHDDAQDFTAHLESRLDAVFRIQTTIANGLLDGVSLGTLIADELLAQSAMEGEALTVEGPDVLLRPDAAATVALTIHELAVNAIKFGALSAPHGRIAVSWIVEAGEGAEPWLALDWIESGVDGVPSEPPRRGFGLDVIDRALTYQFDGTSTLRFAPGGIACTVRLPLSPRVGQLRRTTPAEGSDG